jgi:hypothetical protein
MPRAPRPTLKVDGRGVAGAEVCTGSSDGVEVGDTLVGGVIDEVVEGAIDSPPSVLAGEEPAQPTRSAQEAANASRLAGFRFIMLMDSSPLMEKSPSLRADGG